MFGMKEDLGQHKYCFQAWEELDVNHLLRPFILKFPFKCKANQIQIALNRSMLSIYLSFSKTMAFTTVMHCFREIKIGDEIMGNCIF